MGADKCVLMAGGQPLWQRAWHLLGELASERHVVAPQRPDWCSMSWLPDEPGSGGPLGGLAAALHASTREYVLVLAVDLPDMTAEYLRCLVASGGGVVPEIDGVFQPLSAIYPKAALPVAREHLRQEDVSLQSLVRDLLARGMVKSVAVAAEDRPLFRNLNRPTD